MATSIRSRKLTRSDVFPELSHDGGRRRGENGYFLFLQQSNDGQEFNFIGQSPEIAGGYAFPAVQTFAVFDDGLLRSPVNPGMIPGTFAGSFPAIFAGFVADFGDNRRSDLSGGFHKLQFIAERFLFSGIQPHGCPDVIFDEWHLRPVKAVLVPDTVRQILQIRRRIQVSVPIPLYQLVENIHALYRKINIFVFHNAVPFLLPYDTTLSA